MGIFSKGYQWTGCRLNCQEALITAQTRLLHGDLLDSREVLTPDLPGIKGEKALITNPLRTRYAVT